MKTTERCLAVKNLWVEYTSAEGIVSVLRGVSLDVYRGEIVGIIGESGSGKTTLALAIARILPGSGHITRGNIVLNGRDITKEDIDEMISLHGREVGFIFQDASVALNPVLSIGYQLIEMIRIHEKLSKGKAKRKASELLDSVKIPQATSVLSMYPHELSGGMRQRIMIALATIYRPQFVIADEPTSSLDVLIEHDILKFLLELKKEIEFSMIIISHNEGLLKQICDRVVRLDNGILLEMEGISSNVKRKA